METVFCCPVCREAFCRDEKVYRCPLGHSYDVSSKGYVNLLLNNSQSSHGDNKEMLTARRNFLRAGQYSFLAQAVTEMLKHFCLSDGALLDIGCGEGYYTEIFASALKGKNIVVAGTDISKSALSLANGKLSGIEYAVATNVHLPVKDHSVDTVTALFTPFSAEEVHRILREDGYFMTVSPAKEHLMGLKRAIYETPYENDVVSLDERLFTLVQTKMVQKTVVLSASDAWNLFLMTPYYYKTSKDAQEHFRTAEYLETEFSFILSLYSPVKTAR